MWWSGTNWSIADRKHNDATNKSNPEPLLPAIYQTVHWYTPLILFFKHFSYHKSPRSSFRSIFSTLLFLITPVEKDGALYTWHIEDITSRQYSFNCLQITLGLHLCNVRKRFEVVTDISIYSCLKWSRWSASFSSNAIIKWHSDTMWFSTMS